jgi:hydrogenase maturation protease
VTTYRAFVAGIGNQERGDDAVGAEVARRVEHLNLPGVRVARLREPVQLLDVDMSTEIVVLVDAMRSGAAAGTVVVREIDERPLPAWAGPASTHAVGLSAVVELARVLGRLPAHVVVVGVEAESLATGSALSPAVARAVDEATDIVASVVSEPAKGR